MNKTCWIATRFVWVYCYPRFDRFFAFIAWILGLERKHSRHCYFEFPWPNTMEFLHYYCLCYISRRKKKSGSQTKSVIGRAKWMIWTPLTMISPQKKR